MTYAAYEQSNHDARPVSFYEFRWGNTSWFYCNADRPLMLDAQEYTPAAISESALKQGGERVPEFSLTVPASLPVVALFRGTPPSTRVTVLVRHLHPDDGSAQAKYRWIGPIANVRPKDNASAEIVSRVNGLRRAGLRLTYGRGCKFALFGPGCHVVKSLHANARTVTAIDGNIVTLSAPSPSEGYFNGGFLEWNADGLGTMETRAIERELSAGVYLLFGRGDGITASMAVTAYPGCARNAPTCNTKFANLANYPGLDFMIGVSPFDGKAIF